jgi:hypothetical protein
MKKFTIILIVLIALLSFLAGLAKVTHQPEEVKFLEGFGFNPTLILVYGLIQALGAVLLIFHKTKLVGALISFIAFSLSTVLIFASGNYIFGFISLIPIMLIILVVWMSKKLKVVD